MWIRKEDDEVGQPAARARDIPHGGRTLLMLRPSTLACAAGRLTTKGLSSRPNQQLDKRPYIRCRDKTILVDVLGAEF